MTKDKLQQELLEKVKEGVKPSDLKRPRRIIKPPKDEGYSSGEEQSIPKAPPLPNNQIQNLQAQIQALQKQLQVYKDFKETDLKLKEQYKETIANLQAKNQALEQNREKLWQELQETQNHYCPPSGNGKPETKEPKENIKPEPIKTFLCSECNQVKPQSELSRVFGKYSFCLECSKRARQTAQQEKQKPQPVDFICHLCEQIKTEIPTLIKLDKTLSEYNICSTCKPTAKEFNEADLITDDLWTKYPYSSASEILEKEFGIVRK